MNGGASWASDLYLTDIQQERISRVIFDAGPNGTRTSDVTVVTLGGEELVIARNPGDGLAVRRPDGTWERWEGDAQWGYELSDFPDVRVAESSTLALYLIFGTCLYFCVSLIATARGRVTRFRGGQLVARALGTVVMVPVLLFCFVGPVMAAQTAPDESLAFIAIGSGAMFGGIAIGLSVALPIVMGWTPVVSRRRWFGEAILIALACSGLVAVVAYGFDSPFGAWVYHYRLVVGLVFALVASGTITWKRSSPGKQGNVDHASADPVPG
jgi:hypothetical protein